MAENDNPAPCAGLHRGTVAEADKALNGAIDAAMREAGGDPSGTASGLLQRLRSDPALADVLFVSYAGALAKLSRNALRRGV